jgi:hypothetical protein
MDKGKIYSIVALGSKPDAPLPSANAPFVLAANNAVEIAVLYREKYNSHIIGLVPFIELKRHEHIKHSLIKSRPDEIVVLGGEKDEINIFVKENLGLVDAKIEILSFQACNRLMASALGWRIYLVIMHHIYTRGVKHFLRYVVPDLALVLFGKERDMKWMSCSTGLYSIFYALERFSNAQEIILAGMRPTAGKHISGVGDFTSKTAEADRITLKYWLCKRRIPLWTTDEIMSEVGKMKKWKGETFYFYQKKEETNLL